MLPRERVIKVINHEKPDRVPIYGWVRANLEKQISEVFGSAEAFEDGERMVGVARSAVEPVYENEIA